MTTVKLLRSSMPGAPVLTGQPGALLSVLNAALVDGWGQVPVDTIVISGGIATVTRGAGHPFEPDMVTEVAGATVTGGTINGQRKVLTAPSTTQYTFAAPGIPNQTATGSITHRVAPLGWAREFTGTNLAAYRSPNVASARPFLRVDDTGTLSATAVGYEVLTALDPIVGTGPVPTAAQAAAGAYWTKSATSDTTARPWAIIGDDRGFMLCVTFNSSNNGYSTQYFGDIRSVKAVDPYAWVNMGPVNPSPSFGNLITDADLAIVNNNSGNAWIARGASGLGGSQVVRRVANTPVGGSASALISGGVSSGMMDYPNDADNGLYVSEIQVTVGQGLRGSHPGAYFVPHVLGIGVFAPFARIDNLSSLPGRILRVVPNAFGVMLVDVTGPWAR